MLRRSVCGVTLWVAGCIGASAFAENRFYVDESALLADTAGQAVNLYFDNDISILGLSSGIRYETDKIAVTGVENLGTAAENAEFYDGRILADSGIVGYGCVFAFEDVGAEVLEPDTGRLMGILSVDVLAAEDTTTQITYETVRLNPEPYPPVKNVMTDPDGLSLSPSVEAGTIPIEACDPRITSIIGNTGEPGHVFEITGEHFDRPDLVVRVCGQVAEAELSGETIRVTAPDCGVVDACVDVEMCTSCGCVTEAGGFCFPAPEAPQITSILNGSGEAGQVFQIVGTNLDQPGLAVTVCDVLAEATLRADGTTIDVTAPDCGAAAACVEVEVCTDWGCASEAEGFCFPPPPPPPIIASFLDNEGEPGQTFSIVGENFDAPGLQVRVCGEEVVPTLIDGETLQVTAPDCGVAGDCVGVEVCTDYGCDSRAEGFCFTSPGPRFLRGDTDDSGELDLTDGIRILSFLFTGGPPPVCHDVMDSEDSGDVDLTDAVYIFNFLFLGGPPPVAPYPDCGLDPTDGDSLACPESPTFCL